MVRPKYSVLDIADSVLLNLDSVQNIEIRFGRIRRLDQIRRFGTPLTVMMSAYLQKTMIIYRATRSL